MHGGSSIPEDRLAQAMELIPVSFLQTCGQTEAGVLVTVLDEDGHKRGPRDDPQVLRSASSSSGRRA